MDFSLPWDQIIKLIVAVILGGLIGTEREFFHKPAGIRTHILVCIGAALLTMLSIEMFPNDSARIIASIVTGIGFLGAGTIFKEKHTVQGLTTGASVWLVAAIGIAVGLGSFFISFVTALLIILVLLLEELKFSR